MQAVRWANSGCGLQWGVRYLEQWCEVDRTIKDAYYHSPSGKASFNARQDLPFPSDRNALAVQALDNMSD
ncbi:MAG: hypothetical protein ACREBU_12970 [Nitrososphaera sp.]